MELDDHGNGIATEDEAVLQVEQWVPIAIAAPRLDVAPEVLVGWCENGLVAWRLASEDDEETALVNFDEARRCAVNLSAAPAPAAEPKPELPQWIQGAVLVELGRHLGELVVEEVDLGFRTSRLAPRLGQLLDPRGELGLHVGGCWCGRRLVTATQVRGASLRLGEVDERGLLVVLGREPPCDEAVLAPTDERLRRDLEARSGDRDRDPLVDLQRLLVVRDGAEMSLVVALHASSQAGKKSFGQQRLVKSRRISSGRAQKVAKSTPCG